jgi:hypothetical protein
MAWRNSRSINLELVAVGTGFFATAQGVELSDITAAHGPWIAALLGATCVHTANLMAFVPVRSRNGQAGKKGDILQGARK